MGGFKNKFENLVGNKDWLVWVEQIGVFLLKNAASFRVKCQFLHKMEEIITLAPVKKIQIRA
jgi:hypothetical protein